MTGESAKSTPDELGASSSAAIGADLGSVID